MKRILAVLFLVACVATTVVGCGSSSSASKAGTPQDTHPK